MPRRRSKGCITCKVRRIKCDEAKPTCQRCKMTGRQCDGYLEGDSNLSGRALADASRELCVVGPLSRALESVPSGSSRQPGDEMLYDLFRTQTAPVSANFMPSQFWTHEILQLAHSEPAIWHATVTLAALDRQWNLTEVGGTRHRQSATDLTRVVEGNYARSLSLARNMVGAAPALALSLALSSAANLMGRLDESRMHLMAGRRILTQGGKTTQTARAAEMLLRLDFEAMTFGEQTAPYEYQDTVPLRRLGPDGYGDISSYGDAATALFSMMRTVMLIDEVPLINKDATSELGFLWDLWAWEKGMERLEATKPPASESLVASMSLRLYHTLFRVYLFGDPNDWPQTRLDAHLGIFTRALTLAEGIVRHQKMQPAALMLEPGVIMILWLVGAKCRHPRVRRRILRLMRNLKRQEGPWRSDAMSAVLARVINIEEGGIDGDAREEPGNDIDIFPKYESGDAKAEERRLDKEMSLPWSIWHAPELIIPTYETWDDVRIPPEGDRVKEYRPTISTSKRCMEVTLYMSSEEESQLGTVREEVVWF